jgi:cytochrome c oxidase subunit 2
MRSRITIAAVTVAAAVCSMSAQRAFAQQAVAPQIKVPIDGEYNRLIGLPTDVSRYGYKIDNLIHLTHVFMAVLFVGWGIFFVYCLMKFRQRPGHHAQYELVHAKPSKYLEVAVLVVEVILLAGFSVPIWASVKNDIPAPTGDRARDPFRVRVIAEQFAWNFHYPGADGQFGRTDPKLVDTATNVAGLDRSDPHAQDDVVAGEFHIPVNRPVICDISSKDVIHSFFIPVMRVKQDAMPGMRIPVWFEAVKTGTYEIACAQLCGNNHYSMRAVMFIQHQTDLEAWLAEKSKPPEEFVD